MFLAKPLRFRADLVCARSYAGRAPFFGAALFCALLTLRARSTREFRHAIPLRDCPPSASTSARTQLASCPRKSRCDPALRTTLANTGERTHLAILPRVCGRRCLRSCFCACPSNQSRASARCSLDLRIRSAFRIYVAVDSWRGPGRPARRVQAGLGEEREPACHLRPPRVCPHLAHPSMYGTTCPYLPFGCQSSRQCVVSMRRTSRPFLTYTAPPARRGRRIHAVRELWQGNRPARTKMPLCWQNAREMRFPASDGGGIAP